MLEEETNNRVTDLRGISSVADDRNVNRVSWSFRKKNRKSNVQPKRRHGIAADISEAVK